MNTSRLYMESGSARGYPIGELREYQHPITILDQSHQYLIQQSQFVWMPYVIIFNYRYHWYHFFGGCICCVSFLDDVHVNEWSVLTTGLHIKHHVLRTGIKHRWSRAALHNHASLWPECTPVLLTHYTCCIHWLEHLQSKKWTAHWNQLL